MATILATAKKKPFTGKLGGVSNRTSSPNADVSSKIVTTHPNLNLCSFYHSWGVLEPNAPIDINTSSGYNWTNFETSIETARVHGKKLILRIECGYRCPLWLYAGSTVQPCTKVYLVDENGNNTPGASASNVYVPLPWTSSVSGTPNPNLVAHYTRLVKAINAEMIKSDGAGGLIADHVYYVTIAMATWVGTEMSIGYQSAAAYGGAYDKPGGIPGGVAHTYKAINKAEWDSYGTEANRQTWWVDAWRAAADLHATYIPSKESCVAYGSSFGSFTAPKQMATDYAAKYRSGMCHMTTDLKVDVAPGGTYAGADPNGSTTMLNAINAGGWMGFQSAGIGLIPNANFIKAATDDGLATYSMTFFEIGEPQLSTYYAPNNGVTPNWEGMDALQALIMAQSGQGGRIALKGVKMNAVVTNTSGFPMVFDDFTRSVTGGLGSVSGTQSSGGTYTITGTTADFNVTGNDATIALTAASQTKNAELLSVSMDDIYQSALLQLSALPTGSWCAFDHRLRFVDINNHYRVRCFFNTDGTITLRIVATIAGVNTTLGSGDASTGLTFTANHDYRYLAAAVDTNPTNLMVKFWDPANPEPAGWMLQTNDSSAALQVPTGFCFAAASNAGVTGTPYTFKIREIQAYPNRPSTTTTPGVIRVSGAKANAGAPVSIINPTKRRHTPRHG